MNMNDSPTAYQLLTLIAPMDDQTEHHIVWIEKSGVVHVDTLNVETGPIAIAKKYRGDLPVSYPTLDQRNGYVGPKAAMDDKWIAQLLRELVKGWAERETGAVHYLGLSLFQGLSK